MKKFEKLVMDWIYAQKSFNTYHMSDFYEAACDLLNLEWKDFERNQRLIRYRLNKMKKAGKITSRRIGSGYLGKTDFGSCHHNIYTAPDFWD